MMWFVTNGTIILPDEPKRFRHYAWETLDDPSSSYLAQTLSLFIMVLIVTSTTTFVLQTVPPYRNDESVVWNILETIISVSDFCIPYSNNF